MERKIPKTSWPERATGSASSGFNGRWNKRSDVIFWSSYTLVSMCINIFYSYTYVNMPIYTYRSHTYIYVPKIFWIDYSRI